MASRIVISAVVVILASTLVVSALPVSVPEAPNDPLPGATTTNPAVVGKWSAPFEGSVPAISMAMLPDGSVAYWGGITAGDRDNVFFLDSPESNTQVGILSFDANGAPAVNVIPAPAGVDFFCAGNTILGDGRILVAGGSEWQDLMDPDYQGFVSGLDDTWIFDGGSFTQGDDMAWRRWYPTIMTGADGNAVAVGGIDHLAQPQTMIEEIERLSSPEGDWEAVEGANILLPMYPRVFTIPGGEHKGDLFFETSATLWGPFGEHPLEALWNLEQRLDSETGQWNVVGPSVFGARQHAATVMLPLNDDDGYTARIMTFGGSLGRSIASTPLAEITTINADGSVSHAVADTLGHPRWFANGVLLPDGTVLAVGGGMYDNVYVHGQRVPAVLAAEQYDPATDTWSERAPMTVERMYHSSALLLPDGRVLVGGHVPLPVPWTAFRDNMPWQDQIVETRFEIYEPPYMHKGYARPSITDAPAHVGFGETFTVSTDFAGSIMDAMLIRAGSTTHVWDVNERAIHLDVTDNFDGTVTMTSPPDGNVATPGTYMLFLRTMTEDGVIPGVAAMVNIS